MDVAEAGRAPARSRLNVSRLLIALGRAGPLLLIFVWLCLLYGWQAWGNLTPWLMTDEFERAQLSRAVAKTGHAALRTVPRSSDTLYVYLIAPAWWIHSTTRAYGLAKGIGIVTMTSVVFPTYLLARMLVSRRWALFAAVGAAMIPALAYSSMLLVEPLAYPWAALCFFVVAKALATRRPAWIAAAIAACVVAPGVRGELGVVTAAAVGAALAFWFTGEGGRALRRNWTRWDWLGFVVLSICAASLSSAFIAHHSVVWQITTQHYLGRMVRFGLWAAGALTIGLGVLPTIAGLSALVSTRRDPPSRERRAFVSVTVAMLIAFGLYTATKSAFLSTLGWTNLTERNLIYIAPLLFVGTALVFERRRALLPAVLATTAFALYVVTTTPFHMDVRFFFDAPDLSALEGLGSAAGLTPHGATILLVGLAVASGALLAFIGRFQRTSASLALGLAAAFVLAWSAYGEISFARASHRYGNDTLALLPRPLDWIDRAVPSGARVAYIGQTINDSNGLLGALQLEFWNRSIQQVWSTDGTAPGPGPRVIPELATSAGRLGRDDVRYLVADYGITVVGRVIAAKTHWEGRVVPWKLYRITPPLRVRQTIEGVYGDGWGLPNTGLNQYSLVNDGPHVIRIHVSRAGGGAALPATVQVRVGKLALGKVTLHGQLVTGPVMSEVLSTRTLHVRRRLDHVFELRAPKPPFRVETSVTPLPPPPPGIAFDPHYRAKLGAQISYSVEPG